jgi:succinate-acetate transporter protein
MHSQLLLVDVGYMQSKLVAADRVSTTSSLTSPIDLLHRLLLHTASYKARSMATAYADEFAPGSHPDNTTVLSSKSTVTPRLPSSMGFSNPAPLGLFAFAVTTFVSSCYNAGIWGVQVDSPSNVTTGLAIFYGGAGQVVAGMWEFASGNTLGATAFTSYGAFWLSYAAISVPSFGILEAYEATPSHLKNVGPALGIFLLAWTMFTFFMWLSTFKSNLVLSALFFFLTLTFMFLCSSEFQGANLQGNRLKRVSSLQTC